MKKLISVYDKLEEYFLVYSMIAMVLVVFVQVIFRYIINDSLSWSEELVRYMFMWQVWLGASLGMRINEHIRVDMFIKKLPHLGRKVTDTVVTVMILFFYGFLIWYGFLYLKDVMAKNMTSTALRLPLAAVYVSLPLGSLIIALRYIGELGHLIRGLIAPENAESERGGAV